SVDDTEREGDRQGRDGEGRGGLPRRRMSASGGQRHAEREKPEHAESRLSQCDDNEKKREIMKPDDGREGEGGRDREDEGALVVTTASRDDDSDEHQQSEHQPARPGDGRRQSGADQGDVHRVGVVADRVLEPTEQIRVLDEAGETDNRPGGDRKSTRLNSSHVRTSY